LYRGAAPLPGFDWFAPAQAVFQRPTLGEDFAPYRQHLYPDLLLVFRLVRTSFLNALVQKLYDSFVWVQMTAVFIIVGACLIAIGIFQTRKPNRLAKGTSLALRWKVYTGFLVVLLVGYLAAFVADLRAGPSVLHALTGAVFLIGAVFALAVVQLGTETIVRINLSQLAEQVQLQKAEGMLQELMQVNERITNSNRELEQFAYVTSHDLQEPLRKISAFGDLLAETEADRLSDEGKDHVLRMQKAARRMSELINALLTFSRVSRNEEQPKNVQLKVIVSEVLEDLETSIRNAGATVTTGELPIVEGHAFQLRQLFQNLIGNALKFRREGVLHKVVIDAIEEQGTQVVRISDNGIGFEQQYADKIFGIFQRLHGRNTYEGTGIGLAICQRVAVHHGWEIKALGRPNQGATFEIRLAAKQSLKTAPPNGANERMLEARQVGANERMLEARQVGANERLLEARQVGANRSVHKE
jgi:signal transduction histidine kinase